MQPATLEKGPFFCKVLLPDLSEDNVTEGYCRSEGKSAIHLARTYGERKRNFVGEHFWARGYLVSTVGRDKQVIRDYIRQQESEDKRLDQISLWR